MQLQESSSEKRQKGRSDAKREGLHSLFLALKREGDCEPSNAGSLPQLEEAGKQMTPSPPVPQEGTHPVNTLILTQRDPC